MGVQDEMLGVGMNDKDQTAAWSVLILDAVTIKVFSSCARVSDCVDFNVARK